MLDFVSSPVKGIRGEISVPGDKSISHRSIIFAAIAKGTTTVNGFLEGEDCLATLRAFQGMGVKIEGPTNQRVVIHGVGKYGLKNRKASSIAVIQVLVCAYLRDCLQLNPLTVN